MNDLHELLKRRQDELRGREEDWIDRLFGWLRNVDWVFTGFWLGIVVPLLAMFWYVFVKVLFS